MRLSEVEDIDYHLDGLAQFVVRKILTTKEIEAKIAGAKLQPMLATDNDSLLTVKRKARAFKKLLKEEIPKEVKGSIRQYVNYLDQKNLAKNRKWAF